MFVWGAFSVSMSMCLVNFRVGVFRFTVQLMLNEFEFLASFWLIQLTAYDRVSWRITSLERWPAHVDNWMFFHSSKQTSSCLLWVLLATHTIIYHAKKTAVFDNNESEVIASCEINFLLAARTPCINSWTTVAVVCKSTCLQCFKFSSFNSKLG